MPMTKWNVETDAKALRRLGKLGEELGELQAVVSRCIVQGINEIDPGSGKLNRVRLMEEIADVEAQVHCSTLHFGLSAVDIIRRANQKVDQMEEWEALCAEQDNIKPFSSGNQFPIL
jgi:NTP pyrophosphatase (non-canonical NTP hydrolase)